MKPIKMLGLAVTAALMAMALVGAGSAMASDPTALCLEDPGTANLGVVCPEGQLVKHVHEETLEGNPGLLLSSVVNIECDVLFLGDVTTAGLLSSAPNPLVILGEFTYANCFTFSGAECEVEEVSTHTVLNVLKLAHELADVTAATGAGLSEVNAHCGALINCTYNGVGLTGHALGPLLASEENGEVRVEEQVTNRVSGFCPKTAKLDILTTSLDPIYITE